MYDATTIRFEGISEADFSSEQYEKLHSVVTEAARHFTERNGERDVEIVIFSENIQDERYLDQWTSYLIITIDGINTWEDTDDFDDILFAPIFEYVESEVGLDERIEHASIGGGYGLHADLPNALVHETDSGEKHGSYYTNAGLIVVRDWVDHIWADGMHFVEDPNGEVVVGQYYYIFESSWVEIYRIEEVQSEEESVCVRCVYRWEDEGLSFPNTVEAWPLEQLTSDLTSKGYILQGEEMGPTFLRRVK